MAGPTLKRRILLWCIISTPGAAFWSASQPLFDRNLRMPLGPFKSGEGYKGLPLVAILTSDVFQLVGIQLAPIWEDNPAYRPENAGHHDSSTFCVFGDGERFLKRARLLFTLSLTGFLEVCLDRSEKSPSRRHAEPEFLKNRAVRDSAKTSWLESDSSVTNCATLICEPGSQ